MYRGKVGNEAEEIIRNLNGKIFELEQDQKNFSNLNLKYKGLQSDFNDLSEDKLRMEYEFKQKIDQMSKQILELKEDNANLQQTLDERINLNKKLYNDNSSLHKLSEDKTMELNDLNSVFAELKMKYENLNNSKINLEERVSNMNQELSKAKLDIDQLINDNEKLQKFVEEQELVIKNSDNEKKRLNEKIESLYDEINEGKHKLDIHEDTISSLRKKIEDFMKTNSYLENKISDAESLIEKLNNEVVLNKKEALNEKKFRQDLEITIEENNKAIRDKDKLIRNISIELENQKCYSQNIEDDKIKCQQEIERLRSHTIVLTEENQKYVEELQNMVEQDELVRKAISQRREQNFGILNSNKSTLEKSLTNLDEFLNKLSMKTTN